MKVKLGQYNIEESRERKESNRRFFIVYAKKREQYNLTQVFDHCEIPTDRIERPSEECKDATHID